jgi:23S rRNA (adenine2503-C2)-methyltransferase
LRDGAKVSPAAEPGASRAERANTAPPSLFGLLPEAVGDLFEATGEPRFRGRQVLGWVYGKRVRDPAAMTDLAKPLRARLAEIVSLELPEVAEVRPSAAGDAVKVASRLADGARIESVAMRSRRGVTLCLSTQVGCGMGCAFCATGLLGLARNLKPEEIVAQVPQLFEVTGWQDAGYNLVFMGMGEPLANYESTLRAVRILHHPEGLGVGARRITLSTVGLAPRMRRLAEEGLPLGLAVSLHATTDADRTELVPVNGRYPIASVIEAARYYAERSGRRVTLEYVLLAGRNDRREDARRLSELARSLPCKVNLIPYNPVPGFAWRRPTAEEVERFVGWLLPQSPAVTVRWSQGGDVAAACGQLGARADASPPR